MSSSQRIEQKEEWNISYWALNVGNAILVTLTCLLIFNVLAFQFEYTYYKPPHTPGHLTENRYENPLFWLLWITVIMRILSIVVTTMRIFSPGTRSIRPIHYTIIMMSIASELVSLVYHGITIHSANNSPDESPSGADNVCNDPRYCCVHGTHPNSNCPLLLAPCSPFVNTTDLVTNIDCTISTAGAVTLIVVYLFILLTSFVMGVGRDIYIRSIRAEEEATVFMESNIESDTNVQLKPPRFHSKHK